MDTCYPYNNTYMDKKYSLCIEIIEVRGGYGCLSFLLTEVTLNRNMREARKRLTYWGIQGISAAFSIDTS